MGGAVADDGGESRLKTSAASDIEECAAAHDGEHGSSALEPPTNATSEHGSSALEPPTNATSEVQPCKALLKLRPSGLKERLRLAGIEVPLGVTEKAELVALLQEHG